MARATVDLSRISLSEKMLEEAREVFHKYDVDKSGEIDKTELPALLRELNLRLSPELYAKYCDKFMKEADLDNSSTISSDEFILMFDAVFAPNRLYGAQLRAAAGRGQTEVVTELVARGCNPNIGDGRGWTPSHVAAEFGCTEAIVAMQKLYGADLDIDAEDAAGWTPLFNAASNGRIETLDHLLKSGAHVNAKDLTGKTALHSAAAAGYKDAASLLLANKADFTIADKAGWTALTYAALHQHADTIRVLLEAGASLDQRDVLGYDVRKYCEQPTLKQIDEAQSARAARPSSPRSPRS